MESNKKENIDHQQLDQNNLTTHPSIERLENHSVSHLENHTESHQRNYSENHSDKYSISYPANQTGDQKNRNINMDTTISNDQSYIQDPSHGVGMLTADIGSSTKSADSTSHMDTHGNTIGENENQDSIARSENIDLQNVDHTSTLSSLDKSTTSTDNNDSNQSNLQNEAQLTTPQLAQRIIQQPDQQSPSLSIHQGAQQLGQYSSTSQTIPSTSQEESSSSSSPNHSPSQLSSHTSSSHSSSPQSSPHSISPSTLSTNINSSDVSPAQPNNQASSSHIHTATIQNIEEFDQSETPTSQTQVSVIQSYTNQTVNPQLGMYMQQSNVPANQNVSYSQNSSNPSAQYNNSQGVLLTSYNGNGQPVPHNSQMGAPSIMPNGKVVQLASIKAIHQYNPLINARGPHGISIMQQPGVHPSIQPSIPNSISSGMQGIPGMHPGIHQWKKIDPMKPGTEGQEHGIPFSRLPGEIYITSGLEIGDGHSFIPSNYFITHGMNLNQIEIRNPPLLMPTMRTALESWLNEPSCSVEYWQSRGYDPQQGVIFRPLPKEWYICTKPEQVVQKYNHVNVPKSVLIMNPSNFPKSFSKLIPTRKNAKTIVSFDIQNFHIYLYCWHAVYRNVSNFPDRIPRMSHLFVNMQAVFKDVVSKYGYVNVCQSEGLRGWLSVFRSLPNYSVTITNYTSRLKDYYNRYLLEFENKVAYFSAKRRKLHIVPNTEEKAPFQIDWEYYLHDLLMREVDIAPTKLESSELKVERHILCLGIGLNLENQEEQLKRLPPTEALFCGDIAYSYARKSLILCHTPTESSHLYESLYPLVLVGRMTADVFETLDTLRTEYLKPILEDGGTVKIEILPEVEEFLDEEDDPFFGKKEKRLPPPIIKWGEAPPLVEKKRKINRSQVDYDNEFEPLHAETSFISHEPHEMQNHASMEINFTQHPTPATNTSQVTTISTTPETIIDTTAPTSPTILQTSSIDQSTEIQNSLKRKDHPVSIEEIRRETKTRRVEDSPSSPIATNTPELEYEMTPNSPLSVSSFESEETSSQHGNMCNIGIQTSITFGSPYPTLGIRYRFTGFPDDEYRYIPYNLNEIRSEDFIRKSRLLQILHQDNVPTEKLRELRYYFQGPNEKVSGWMLVDDRFKFRIPKHNNNQVAPMLSLKLTFNKSN